MLVNRLHLIISLHTVDHNRLVYEVDYPALLTSVSFHPCIRFVIGNLYFIIINHTCLSHVTAVNSFPFFSLAWRQELHGLNTPPPTHNQQSVECVNDS